MPKANPKQKMIDAAMKIAAKKGWREVSKPVDVLLALIEIADKAQVADDLDGSVREKLVEMMMRRFDALQKYKSGLAALEKDKTVWPSLARELMPALVTSARGMLREAGAGDDHLRALVWLGIKGDVARVWFSDEG